MKLCLLLALQKVSGTTVMRWKADSSVDWGQGTFGHTTYDADNNIIYKVRPKLTKFNKSFAITVNNLETVKFETNSDDGFLGLISVETDGVLEEFHCIDCDSSSSSTELGRLYLDTDITRNLPGTANCKQSCTFKRGPAPSTTVGPPIATIATTATTTATTMGTTTTASTTDDTEIVWGIDAADNVLYRDSPEGDWESVTGSLKQITTGPMGVFGIDASGAVHYRQGTHNNPLSSGTGWQHLESKNLKSISSGLTSVFGVDKSNKIFYMKNIELDGVDLSYTWAPLDGDLMQISASGVNEAIWGVMIGTSQYGNYTQPRYKANLSAPWQDVTGSFIQVSVGKMGVFGVNKYGDVWYRVGTNENPAAMGTLWQRLPGNLVQISVGTHNVWGVNKDNMIWELKDIQFNTFPKNQYPNQKINFKYQQIDGAFTHISALSTLDDTTVITTSVTSTTSVPTTSVTTPLTTTTTKKKGKKTVLEWETDSSETWGEGHFGFTVYDADSNIIYKKDPIATKFTHSAVIRVDDIESIKFETNHDDGFLGLINVKMGGVNQLFHCVDCISSSSSTELGRLYLDTDMNGPQDLPGTANCQNTCTFRRGPAPPPPATTVAPPTTATTATKGTVLEWETDSSETWGEGHFGFTAYDADSNIIYQRNPIATKFGDSNVILVNNIETIKFETNHDDGFLGLINVKMDGVNQLFHCIDCIASSSSTDLGRLYVDTDMNGPQDLPGTANCQNTCTFRRGPAPPPPATTVRPPVSKEWHGDKNIATWEFPGGFREWHGNYNSLFDNLHHDRRMYHSSRCDGERGIKITFKNGPVKWEDLKFYTRQACCRERYGGVCLLADGVKVACTPDDFPASSVPKFINMKQYALTEDIVVGTEFKLMWPLTGDDTECAQVEELFFNYDDSVTSTGPPSESGSTVLEWETDSSETWGEGHFGFTVYDADSNIIHQRNPIATKFGDSDVILVNNVETIKFETHHDDGFLGLINVKMDGVNQLFHCIDCIASSSTTELGRLYVDTDMNGPQDLPGTANCQNTCTFKRSSPAVTWPDGVTQSFDTVAHYNYMEAGPIAKLAEMRRGVRFSVQAENDIHISLSSSNPITTDSWEIAFGAMGGGQSLLRSSHQGANLVTVHHTKDQFLKWQQNFEFKLTRGDTRIGLYDSEGNAIIEYDQFDATNIKYLYIATGWGSTGKWLINLTKDGFEHGRDPSIGLDKVVARFGTFMATQLASHSGFIESVNGKLEKLRSRMMAQYEKLNLKCDLWSESNDEEDEGLRYDQENPCKAAVQIPKAMIKWSRIYNVPCKSGSHAFSDRIQTSMNKITEKLQKKLRNC